MASSPDSAALPCRFPRARGAGRLRPTRASRRLLFSDIGSERTLLRRLAAVDISLGADSVWRRGVVGGAGRGAASYGVKVRNSPIATISLKRISHALAAWGGRTTDRPDMLSGFNRLESLHLRWEMR